MKDWTPERCFENSSGMQALYGPWPALWRRPPEYMATTYRALIAPPVDENLADYLARPAAWHKNQRYYTRFFVAERVWCGRAEPTTLERRYGVEGRSLYRWEWRET